MKKSLLVTTVAALLTTAAHATTYDVSSNVTGLQLYLFTYELLTAESPGHFTDVKFGGTATDADNNGTIDSAALTLVGEAFFSFGPQFRLTFNLGSGDYTYPSGTIFSSGTIQFDTYMDVSYWTEAADPDFQWVPFSTVDANVTNLLFLAGQPGHLTIRDPDTDEIIKLGTTAGLLLAPGTHALPGLWDGQIGGAGFNNGLGSMPMFGDDAGVFMQGTITLTPQAVPLPAPAWLFSSALMGLVGASRKRRVAQ